MRCSTSGDRVGRDRLARHVPDREFRVASRRAKRVVVPTRAGAELRAAYAGHEGFRASHATQRAAGRAADLATRVPKLGQRDLADVLVVRRTAAEGPWRRLEVSEHRPRQRGGRLLRGAAADDEEEDAGEARRGGRGTPPSHAPSTGRDRGVPACGRGGALRLLRGADQQARARRVQERGGGALVVDASAPQQDRSRRTSANARARSPTHPARPHRASDSARAARRHRPGQEPYDRGRAAGSTSRSSAARRAAPSLIEASTASRHRCASRTGRSSRLPSPTRNSRPGRRRSPGDGTAPH